MAEPDDGGVLLDGAATGGVNATEVNTNGESDGRPVCVRTDDHMAIKPVATGEYLAPGSKRPVTRPAATITHVPRAVVRGRPASRTGRVAAYISSAIVHSSPPPR
jgi:hypothetical protein